GAVAAAPKDRQAFQIVSDLRIRHALALVEDPCGHCAAARLDGPACTRLHVEERIEGAIGSNEGVAGADLFKIGECGPVAAHQKMVAAVDQMIERLIEKRAAAPAGLACAFIDVNRRPLSREPNSRCQAREAGTDDVDCAQGTTSRAAVI